MNLMKELNKLFVTEPIFECKVQRILQETNGKLVELHQHKEKIVAYISADKQTVKVVKDTEGLKVIVYKNSYNVLVAKNCIKKISKFLGQQKKHLLVTDARDYRTDSIVDSFNTINYNTDGNVVQLYKHI